MAWRQKAPPVPYKDIGQRLGRTDLACRLHINQMRRRGSTASRASTTSPPARCPSAYEIFMSLKLYRPPPPVSQDETIAAAQSLQELSVASTETTASPSTERSARMDIKDMLN